MEIKRLILLGTTGSGKSRFGNKFSKKHIFKESEEPDSCTKGIYRAYNDYGVEIIDTQGLNDTNDEDKKGLTSIFNEIKENKPNILVYVQNSSDKRFGKYSKNAITKICQMFNTKSVWNNFIVIFTFADSISKENREKVATNFIEKILDVVKECYKNKNDSVPLPKKLNYFL